MKETLKARIDFLVTELHDLMVIINNGYNVANRVDQEDLKRIYYEELLPFVQDFENVSIDLKNALEAYFEEEKKQNLPIDLNLHKLHKRISGEFKV